MVDLVVVKFLKLELFFYNGDKIKFKEFWDVFEVIVYRNYKFFNIEKFNYFRSKFIEIV